MQQSRTKKTRAVHCFSIFLHSRSFSMLLLADLLFFHAKFEGLGCASVDRIILSRWAYNNDEPSSSPNKESQSACLLFVHGAPEYYVMAWHNYRVRQRAVYGKRSRDTNLDCVSRTRQAKVNANALLRATCTIYFR